MGLLICIALPFVEFQILSDWNHMVDCVSAFALSLYVSGILLLHGMCVHYCILVVFG